MSSLLDLKLFQEIEEGLKFLDTNTFFLAEGEPPPENVVFLGKMPDALKGLLELRQRSAQLEENSTLKLIQEGATYSEEQIQAERERLRVLDENTKFFDKLFWKALADQFGIVIGERAFGFTEDFEVYVDP